MSIKHEGIQEIGGQYDKKICNIPFVNKYQLLSFFCPSSF